MEMDVLRFVLTTEKIIKLSLMYSLLEHLQTVPYKSDILFWRTPQLKQNLLA